MNAFLRRLVGAFLFLAVLCVLPCGVEAASASTATNSFPFPVPLESYDDGEITGVMEKLKHRIDVEPFNLIATLLFLGAICHTFLTQKFRHWSHVLEDRHRARIQQTGRTASAKGYKNAKDDVSFGASIFHFLGEVEAVFGIWVVPLMLMMLFKFGADNTVFYVNDKVSYHEPIFVVIIMALAATKPVLNLAETVMRRVAALGGGSIAAWWFSILTVGPLMGSFITEPAAMTIAASLLSKQFYALKPRPRFAYATLGLLFVNISVGGTLTHFAAPPVLMVAKSWGWDTPFMMQNFGWHAAVGIMVANVVYYLLFRSEFESMVSSRIVSGPGSDPDDIEEPVPIGVTVVHLIFIGWAVVNAHHPVFLFGGFLFFLAFYQATEHFQYRLELRSPILVGFFLAGLVIHGGLQQWWIEPILGSLSEFPLFVGATVLTAFNDNAAITYLATLVPNLSDALKHAVVAGAVTGGGLTVIANAPNPAGQSILNRFFEDGISPMGLLLGALLPTVVVGSALFLLK
ncbi:MAG TPA: hypothetical protein DCY13_23435 [Verrucomicrobiales bacterium]|nr:hypothetical protein [Verrucomicrobiales bacterium]